MLPAAIVGIHPTAFSQRLGGSERSQAAQVVAAVQATGAQVGRRLRWHKPFPRESSGALARPDGR